MEGRVVQMVLGVNDNNKKKKSCRRVRNQNDEYEIVKEHRQSHENITSKKHKEI